MPLDLRWGVSGGDFNHILVCLNEVQFTFNFKFHYFHMNEYLPILKNKTIKNKK